MGKIPLDEAELIAIFLETFLYGIFFTLFWITIWILLKKPNNRSLIAVLIVMIVLSTSHIVIDWIRIIDAFIFHRNPAIGGPIGYYSQISHPLLIAKNVIYALMALTGDSVMAWRCYVINRRSILIIIVPVALIICTIVSAAIVLFKILTAPIDTPIFSIAVPWLTTFFVLGLCTNIYSTSLIVYRIWRSVRSLGPYQKHGSGLIPVVMALVESGALHASAWLALLITYLSDSNGQYTVLDTITPLIGVVFTLIIIQTNAYASKRTSVGNTNRPDYPMHPIDITVTTHTAMHTDQMRTPMFNTIAHGVSNEGKRLESAKDGLAERSW